MTKSFITGAAQPVTDSVRRMNEFMKRRLPFATGPSNDEPTSNPAEYPHDRANPSAMNNRVEHPADRRMS
jgi:hypothetical protein